MKLGTLAKLMGKGRMRPLRTMTQLASDFTRTCFLAAAGANGVLRALASGPRSAEGLAQALSLPPQAREGLEAWLEVGVATGELMRTGGGFALSGHMAKTLAAEANDDVLAMLEEVASLHHKLVMETPARLRRGARFTLADQSGTVVARSSRVIEPVVQEAIAGVLPTRGPLRLLEVGCGSGTHMRFALERNPELVAAGLELQPEVAAQARANLAAWGLAARATVEVRDFREKTPSPEYDVLTLHNNIYYFPDAERVALLRHARAFLKPGGRLLLTTACRGGGISVQVLHLWGVMTEGGGPLPAPEELLAQLDAAGFRDTRATNHLAPLDRFYGFTGDAPLARASTPRGGVGP